MKVMCYTGSHVDHRTGPDWPVFVTDSQQSGTSSNKIDLILDVRLLVINRPLRPRGDRQARPRGPEEVVERWLRTVEPVKQLRQGEGIHGPGCSIRDPAFTGSRDRDPEARPGSPNAVTVRGTSIGTRKSMGCSRDLVRKGSSTGPSGVDRSVAASRPLGVVVLQSQDAGDAVAGRTP
jgi:hypothetical protein